MLEMAAPGGQSGNGAVPHHARIGILGAGFGGLGMAIRLKQVGIDDFVAWERDAEVGGTWWANTYPGCQCDVPSHLYSFSFAPNPGWSRTFSRQPEIQEYLRRCADEHDIGPHLRFGHEVTAATWDEGAQLWRLETTGGPFTPRLPAAQRLMRAGIYWARETFVLGFLHRRLMRLPERIARRHLRSQVRDRELRAKLTPDYAIGCKRILISNDFYPALTQPNVDVVT